MNTDAPQLDSQSTVLSFSLTQSKLVCLNIVNDIQDFTGYSSQEFLSGSIAFKQLFHDNDLDIAQTIFSHSQQTTAATTLTLRIITKGGRIKILTVSYTKQHTPKQQITLIELSIQPPTHLEVGAVNHSALTNFIAMLESTNDYIYFKDRHHIFTGASQTLVEITEHTQHWTDLVGKTDYDIFTKEYADIYYTLEKKIFSGDLTVAQEIQPTLDNKGNQGWVDNRKYPIKDSTGTIIGLFGIARDITEIKRAKDALQISENRLEEAQSVANMGNWEHNLVSNQLIWSDGLYRIAELDKAISPSYQKFSALIHPEDQSKTSQIYLQAVAKHKAYEVEFRLRMQDGRIKYILERGESFYNSNNQAIRTVGIIQDITLEQRPRDLLAKLNHDFAHLSGSLFFQAICQHIAETMQLDYVFIGLTANTGQEIDVVAGWGLNSALPSFSYALKDTPCAEVLSRNACVYPDSIQSTFPKDDLLIQMGIESYVGIPLLDAQKNRLGVFVALHSKALKAPNEINELFDITSTRVSSEILREKALHELQESQLRFHHVAQHSRTFLWEINPDGLYTYCSPESEQILGFLPEDLVGKKHYYDLHPSKGRASFKKNSLVKIKNKEPFHSFQNQIVSKSGETLWVSTSGQAITDEQGNLLAYQGGDTDISKRKRSESREKLRTKALELMATGEPLSSILEAVVLNLEKENPAMLCSILLLTEDGQHLIKGAAPSLPNFYNEAIDCLEIGEGVGSCGTAAYTGERVIAEDLQTHPYWAVYKELTHKAKLGSCWSEPIIDSKKNVLGTFAIYHHQAQTPKSSDIQLIEQTASLASIAIEKEKTNQALDLSNKRWQFALEGAGGAVWEFNLKTQVNMVSNSMLSLLKIPNPNSTEEFHLLPNWSERLHPDSAEPTFTALSKVLNNESDNFYIEQQVRRDDGHYIWLLSRGIVVSRSEDKQPLLMVGSSEDITERKQAETKLQLAASVFSHAREGIMITDVTGAIIDVNQTFTSITGYSREEILGQNPRVLQSDRQSKDFYKAMWKALLEKGHWYGEVWNCRKNGEVFAEMLTISAARDTQGNTKHYVALFTDITTIKEHQKQLEHIAHYDVLTKLPNRALFADRLSQSIVQTNRRKLSLAVVFLDLDGFKAINDNHGHDIGDELLVTVSRRMEEALREGDTIARFGGDEFIAVLVDLEKVEDCEPVLDRLLTAASDIISIDQKQLQVSASIGVTIYPQDNADTDQLIRHADQAMYIAKQSGKNRYHLFDTAYDNAVKFQRENIEGIRIALDEQQFVLFYQPKVNLKTGEIIGAEALIRWQHPERGLVPPLKFLPLIDDHFLSIEIGNWVIETALKQILSWKNQGLDMHVSVNIGALQLQQETFTHHLSELLSRYPDVNPQHLELEVLETSALGDMSHVSSVMNASCKLGVQFALDDFGTGYSSLTHLRRLPAHLIKIDQSFVRDMLVDPEDLAIIEGVIGLAKAFQREVIAEGVETMAHGQALIKLGCHLAQGYGIAKPMPAHELPSWAKYWQSNQSWTE